MPDYHITGIASNQYVLEYARGTGPQGNSGTGFSPIAPFTLLGNNTSGVALPVGLLKNDVMTLLGIASEIDEALDDWVVTWDSIEAGTLPLSRLPSVVARRDQSNAFEGVTRINSLQLIDPFLGYMDLGLINGSFYVGNRFVALLDPANNFRLTKAQQHAATAYTDQANTFVGNQTVNGNITASGGTTIPNNVYHDIQIAAGTLGARIGMDVGNNFLLRNVAAGSGSSYYGNSHASNTGHIYFQTAGANRLAIANTGRVLIGSTLPTDDGGSALQVNGTITTNGAIRTSTFAGTLIAAGFPGQDIVAIGNAGGSPSAGGLYLANSARIRFSTTTTPSLFTGSNDIDLVRSAGGTLDLRADNGVRFRNYADTAFSQIQASELRIPSQVTSSTNVLRVYGNTGGAFSEPVCSIAITGQESRGIGFRSNGFPQFLGGFSTGASGDFAVGVPGVPFGFQRGSGQRFFLGENDTSANRLFQFDANTSNQPSFGWSGRTSTTNSQAMLNQYVTWADSTHATRRARSQWYIFDATGEREAIRIESNGSEARVGIGGAVGSSILNVNGNVTVGTNSSIGSSSGRLDLRPANGRTALYNGLQNHWLDVYNGETLQVTVNDQGNGNVTARGIISSGLGYGQGASALVFGSPGHTGYLAWYRGPSQSNPDQRQGYFGYNSGNDIGLINEQGGNFTTNCPVIVGNYLETNGNFGQKINLFPGQNWGLGIQDSTVQFINGTSASRWVFGWGSSASLNEVFSISATGNLSTIGALQVGTQLGFANSRLENPSTSATALKAYETSLATWQEPWRGQASASGATIGFLGATPIGRQTLPAAATDATTTQSLANALRTLAINFGLAN